MLDQKTKKYDRQLRLWQAHGQLALESAKVLVLGADACGTELLKNLVLPGIGSFTLVDGQSVSAADVGNNFFIDPNGCLGNSRAKVAAELLRELNQDVAGCHVDEDPVKLIDNQPNFFLDFSIVITSINLPQKSIAKLASILYKHNIPLVVARIYGFIGYIRLAVPEHTIVETHPEQIIDLRLDAPFTALTAFVDTFDFNSMDSHELSHVPYVVILLKCLAEYRKRQASSTSASTSLVPKTSQERAHFKDLIRESMALKPLSEPENFEEALNAAYRVSSPTSISSSLRQILDHPNCKALTPKSPPFWIMARALADFIEQGGVHGGLPPVAGTLPDMKSDTESFVKLQTIYRDKARSDAKSLHTRVEAHLAALNLPTDTISLAETELFAKHAQYLKVVFYSSLADEYSVTAPGDDSTLISPEDKARGAKLAAKLVKYGLESDLESNVVYYVLFRAVDRFFETYHRYPGIHDNEVETDIALLKKCVTSLLTTSWGLSASAVSDDHIHEMVRAGASQMHNIAALVGGMASQEVIKLITHQYGTLDNTLIFNGIKSTSTSICL